MSIDDRNYSSGTDYINFTEDKGWLTFYVGPATMPIIHSKQENENMLEIRVYVQASTGMQMLEVKQSIHGVHGTNVSYFYTGLRDGKWYRMTTARADKVEPETLFALLKEAECEEYPKAVAWLVRYHLPKAEFARVE